MTLRPNHRIDPEKQRIKLSIPKEKDAEIEQEVLDTSPCYFCGEIRICGEGQMISPLNCQKLSSWLEKRQRD